MARILLLVVLIVTVKAHRHHPKFPKCSEDYDTPVARLRKVQCSSENERQRNEIIEKSKCGSPKDVFIFLTPHAAHEQVSPGAVWVKRCVGLCDGPYGSECVAIKKRTKYIPIRIYSAKTEKETCSSYEVEEHLSCGCCAGSPESCASPRVYDPRKCACRCPNRLEKRMCRNKPNQIMRWNPSKCACEVKFRLS